MKKNLISKTLLFAFVFFNFILIIDNTSAKINNLNLSNSWIIDYNKENNSILSDNIDWIIVKFNNTSKVSKSTLNSIATTNWLIVKESIDELNLSLLELNDKWLSVSQAISSLKNDPRFEYVQPNFIYRTQSLDSNDLHNDNLWWLYNFWQLIESQTWSSWSDISFDKALKIYSWSTNLSNTWVIIAVLDSWVSYNHVDLINQMWDWTNCKNENWIYIWWCIHWYDYADNDKNPQWEVSQHWTHVAWTIAAQLNNWKWIIWVNPNSKIMALRMGNNTFTTLAIVKSIYFAKENWAKIINASFWSTNTYIDRSQYDAIKSFTDAWGIFIAAAWNNWTDNDNLSTRFFPASYWITNYLDSNWYLTWSSVPWWTTLHWITSLISVAASDNIDWKSSFSNYWLLSVNISAPGTSIYSTILPDILHFNQSLTWVTLDLSTGWLNNNWWLIWWKLRTDVNTPFATWADTYIEKELDISLTKYQSFHFWVWCDAWKTLPWLNNYSTDYLQLSFSSWWTYNEYWKFNYTSTSLPYIWWWWYYWTFTIPISVYKSSNFKFRFTWHTDNIVDSEDWCFIFNDLSVIWKDDTNLDYYKYYNWTSMASPHVAWLASYLWSYKPNLSAVDIKNAILQNWDSIISMNLKSTTWKRINTYSSLLSLMNVWNISNFKVFSNNTKLHEIPSWSYTNIFNPYFEWQDDVWIESLSWYLFQVIDNSGTIIDTSFSKNKFYTGFIIPVDWIYNFSLYEELINWKTWSIQTINNITFDTLKPTNISNLTYNNLLTWSLASNFSISGSWNLIDSWSIVNIVFSWSNIKKSYSWFLLGHNFMFNWLNLSDISDWNILLESYLTDKAWNVSDTSSGLIFKETDAPTWSISFVSWSYINNLNTDLLLWSSESWTYILYWTWFVWTMTWVISWSKNHNISLTWSNWIKIINYQISDLYWNVSPVYSASINYDNIQPTILSLSHTNLQNVYSNLITLTWIISEVNMPSSLLINWQSATLSSTWFFSKNLTLLPGSNSINISITDLAWNNSSTWITLIRIWNAPNVYSSISSSWTLKFDIVNEFSWISYFMFWTWDLNNFLTWWISTWSTFVIPYLSEDTTYYYRAYSIINWYNSIYSNTWSITTPKNLTISDYTWSLTLTWNINLLDSSWTWVNFIGTWSLRLYSNSWSSYIDIPKFWVTILSLSWIWDWIIEAPHLTNNSWSITIPWFTRLNNLTYKIWSNSDALIFSWWKVIVSLEVWENYNGKLLKIYQSEDNQLTFMFVSECVVENWMCSFQTDRFSDFTVLEPSLVDSLPNNFTFNPIINSELSTLYSSNSITISWMNTSTWITTTIWNLFINWIDVWLNWIVNSWSTVVVKLLSSTSYNSPVSANISAWWYSTSFIVTTKQLSSWWGWGWWGWWSSSTTITTKTYTTSSWTTLTWSINSWSTNINSLTWVIISSLSINYLQKLDSAKFNILKSKNWKEFIDKIDKKISRMSKNEIELMIKNLNKINANNYPTDYLNYLEAKLYIELNNIANREMISISKQEHDKFVNQLLVSKIKLSKSELWKKQIKSVDKLLSKKNIKELEVLFKNIQSIKSKINKKTNYKNIDLINYIEASIILKLWK